MGSQQRHPERSRGIPLRNRSADSAGSFGSAQDDNANPPPSVTRRFVARSPGVEALRPIFALRDGADLHRRTTDDSLIEVPVPHLHRRHVGSRPATCPATNLVERVNQGRGAAQFQSCVVGRLPMDFASATSFKGSAVPFIRGPPRATSVRPRTSPARCNFDSRNAAHYGTRPTVPRRSARSRGQRLRLQDPAPCSDTSAQIARRA